MFRGLGNPADEIARLQLTVEGQARQLEKARAETISRGVNPTIAFDGQSIILEFPENGNSITIPIEKFGIETNSWGTPLPSQRGWKVLLDILKERYSKSHREERTISHKASPTEYQVEQWLKANSPKQGTKKRASEELSLEDLDI